MEKSMKLEGPDDNTIKASCSGDHHKEHSGTYVDIIGNILPEDFVVAARKIETVFDAQIWLLIQNGHSSIDLQVYKYFYQHRKVINKDRCILILESPGGSAHAAYSIARLFQRRTKEFMVWVPQYAKSAATLLALGAKKILLGKDAELGPLDVQILDIEREDFGSALDAVQALERLNAFVMTAVDQFMPLLAQRTGKKLDTLLPLVLNYATNFVRPLLDKIDTVDFTKKSRELKVAEDYAIRLMKKNYDHQKAKIIAGKLVEQYPTHGFVIDAEEAISALGIKAEEETDTMKEYVAVMEPYLNEVTLLGNMREVVE